MHFAYFDMIGESNSSGLLEIPSAFPDALGKRIHEFFGGLSSVSNAIADYITDDKTALPRNHSVQSKREGQPWQRLEHFLAGHIASFLSPEDLSAFSIVSRFFNSVFRHTASNGSTYWKHALSLQYPSFPNTLGIEQNYVIYLHSHLIECETEYRHFKSAEHCYRAFYEYCTLKRGGGILGLVCDICWLDDEHVAKVLSRKRYMAMLTVLTERERDVHVFKKAITDTGKGPRSFVPVARSDRNIEDADLLRVQRCHLQCQGFVGFAVNLIRLRPEHEYLRYTVFWGLFRDLMVFRTREDAWAYAQFLTSAEIENYWVVTLDQYTEEELEHTYPRMKSRRSRDMYRLYNKSPVVVEAHLVRQRTSAQISFEYARYMY